MRLWNIENMEEIPEVLEKRRTEGAGIHVLKVRNSRSILCFVFVLSPATSASVWRLFITDGLLSIT